MRNEPVQCDGRPLQRQRQPHGDKHDGQKCAIDIINYSMMITLAMGVGILIPPIGIDFYVSCSVSESRFEATGRAMLPYLAVLLVGVLIVAFVPWFTLAVPRLIQGH